jgi:hypothetical protein
MATELKSLKSRIEEAAGVVCARSAIRPEVGVILGTGLGDFADALRERAVVPYAQIPHFPISTVESHAGELHLGKLAGRAVAVMKGRVHYYEGYSMRDVAFPVRVLKAIGCKTLIITSAVGAMNPNMPPGTIVVNTDHINLMGDNPLIGENDESLGPRFPDMSEPYARPLIALAERVALAAGHAAAARGVRGALRPHARDRRRVPLPALDRRRHRRHVVRARDHRGGARRPARAGVRRGDRSVPARSPRAGQHREGARGRGAHIAHAAPPHHRSRSPSGRERDARMKSQR